MGDRANFGFRKNAESPILYLYSHWGGDGMLATLAVALKRATPRWDDHAYGTRICISNIIGNSWTGEYGYGLTIDEFCDNEHSVPVVDWATNTVTLYPHSWNAGVGSDPKFIMPFTAFIAKFWKAS